MIQELQLRILPEEAVSEQSLKQVVARETGISVPYIHTVRVLKRSIDARQRTIYVNVKLRAFINEQPDEPEFQLVEYKDVSAGKPVVVVGAGPGGLFAALRLIELGLRPIVIERGKNVRERKKDIALISREHKVDGESNYSFGEGGAGAYSDGKLYTRSKKRGSVDKILNVFCQFGALWWGGPFRDTNGCLGHPERGSRRCRNEYGRELSGTGHPGNRSFRPGCVSLPP